MSDYEKLGSFYLGRSFDLASGQLASEKMLYEANDLTTHAVCVGMTGSGKTGLCLALLEEAGIDNIPAIIIDPKGDLSNLLLTFPQLRTEDFAPWIDAEEAKRAGTTPDQLATKTAETWKKGLDDWGQDGARIQRLRDAVDIAIYTPGSSTGLPLTVLRSFDAPPASTRDNNEAMREAVSAAASGLLGLLGIDADPLKSREHILISNILDRAWAGGKNLDMAALIRALQSPGFDKVGVMDLESFYPAKERFELSMQLNNLLASPGFSAWMQGEPLDIQRLLYTPEGKPRLAILSISHLSDAERMFFVTILLSNIIGWMRSQPGTSSLRALLYMDEVFGYFPPSKNPPSKVPMLTLLKQARAFGLGVVLATQNPVDLDYKGLANCGTWFLGRLQTERDKMRVLDGLEGASSASGASFNRAEMDQLLSGLGNRVFLMNNVHEDHPVVFQTRWALSYLRGPMTREQIGKLMAERKATTATSGLRAEREDSTRSGAAKADRPVLPPEIIERFVSRRANLPTGATLTYHPALLGQAKLHFAQAATGVDCWQDVSLLLPIDDAVPGEIWAKAEEQADGIDLEQQPEAGAKFASLPAELSRPKRYLEFTSALKDHLYRNRKLRLWKCLSLKQTSLPNENEGEFRMRLSQQVREERDGMVESLRQKNAPKHAKLQERRRKAELKVDKEKSQFLGRIWTTAISIGKLLLSIMQSHKRISISNISRAASSADAAGRVLKERPEIAEAKERVESIDQEINELNSQLEAEIAKIDSAMSPEGHQLEEVVIQPRKSDVNISQVTLVWTPQVLCPEEITLPGS